MRFKKFENILLSTALLLLLGGAASQQIPQKGRDLDSFNLEDMFGGGDSEEVKIKEPSEKEPEPVKEADEENEEEAMTFQFDSEFLRDQKELVVAQNY